jgi:hypothetical protein
MSLFFWRGSGAWASLLLVPFVFNFAVEPFDLPSGA